MRKSRMGVLTAVLAAACAFPVTDASATAAHAATGASCSIETLASKPYSRVNGGKAFKSTIQLRWNSCTHRVWAKEVGQAPYDHIWVFNLDRHVTASTSWPHDATSSINDRGTVSHACMDNETMNYLRMYKTCTKPE